MKTIFKEITELDHVTGCLFINKEGQVVHAHFPATPSLSIENHNWPAFIKGLGNISEADILFEDKKVLMRKTTTGYLLVVTEHDAILSLIKLHCDILVPKLNDYKPKGISRFFRK
jgi:predicted regulator of Ras-like GTPase activity (Roadblock/LC7/MglB family)